MQRKRTKYSDILSLSPANSNCLDGDLCYLMSEQLLSTTTIILCSLHLFLLLCTSRFAFSCLFGSCTDALIAFCLRCRRLIKVFLRHQPKLQLDVPQMRMNVSDQELAQKAKLKKHGLFVKYTERRDHLPEDHSKNSAKLHR